MQNQRCEQCGNNFQDYASNHRKYCGVECKKLASHVDHIHECLECKVSFIDKKKNSKYCSMSCSGKNAARQIVNHRGNTNRGEKHWNWRGGGTINTQGYREIPLGKTNKKILEHRLVVEKHLSRKLSKTEHVHHINGDKLDNRIENLIVLSPAEHQRVHNQRRWHGIVAFV